MVLVRNVSDSDIQNETLRLALAPVRSLLPIGASTSIAATTSIVAGDSPARGKKRTREQTQPQSVLTTSPKAPAVVPISDDSDSSSDEEKSPQRCTSESKRFGVLKQSRFQLIGSKRRRRKHYHKNGGNPRRRVVFGDVESTTKYHPSNLTKEEVWDLKRDLWFTKKDRLKSQAECLEILKSFKAQNAEEVTRFSTVYRTSMQVPFSKASSDYLETATVSIPLTIRGMEWGIAPRLKKRRREHIKSVLALQKHISNVDLLERFVSNRSLQSSRPARIMARIIGEGDASDSRSGTTSTALNVTTVPMAKTNRKKTTKKVPISGKPLLGETQLGREEPQNNYPTGATDNTTDRGAVATAIPATPCAKRSPKIGHARRRRRPILWRK